VGSIYLGQVCDEQNDQTSLTILRYLGLGLKGVPLMTAEPMRGDLLPSNDKTWELGRVDVNLHVFNATSEQGGVDGCGRAGQAAQILGRVLRHKNEQHDLEWSFRLEEAMQLHRTLLALDSVLQQTVVEDEPHYTDGAIAICSSARFILYDMYACNEKYDSAFPTGQEAAMQKIAIDGLMQTTRRVYQLAVHIRAALKQDDATVNVCHYPNSFAVSKTLIRC
jgi:hypothetical protein